MQVPSDHHSSPEVTTSSGATKRIILEIVSPGMAKVCNFWISFYKKGAHTAKEICAKNSLEAQMALAGKVGFRETMPIMLTESVHGAQIFQLFLPYPSDNRVSLDKKDVIQHIDGWRPEAVGLYVSEQLFGKPGYIEFMEELTLALIRHGSLHHVYFQSGAGQYSEILQMLCRLRQKLDYIEIAVFH